MLHLHETTRRRVGRVALIALCAAPTLAMTAWIAWRLLPGGDARQSHRLSTMLQATVAATEWRQPRPNVVRIASLSLGDAAEGSATFGEARGLQWRFGGGRCVASLDSATVTCCRMTRLAKPFAAWLDQLATPSLQVRCRQLELRAGGTAPGGATAVLHGVQVDVERDAAGIVRCRLTGRAAKGAAATSQIRLTLEHSSGGVPTIHVMLDTAEAPVSASLLACVAPGFDRLGAQATFTGMIGGRTDGETFVGAATGRLEQVDLAAALPAGSPHTVRGEATVELSELKWRGDRVALLAGRIDARDALVSPSLPAAAAEYMRCPHERVMLRGGLDSGHDKLIAVDRLNCRFRLDGEGLLLTGDAASEENSWPGCLATSGGRPLAFEPGEGPMPAGAWIQFLLGPSQSWLPATRQAVDIAERLPLPGGGTVLR
jgi:hypothetical protein